MIEIRDLTKTFGPVKAIDGLTIDFSDGVTGLVGENGAGKSTLFRLISGVLIPDSGSIAIDGFPAESKEAKEKLFFLTDDPYFPSGADLKGVADFYGCFYKLDRRKFEFLSAGKFGLPQKGRLSTFSKGMRRRAFIALAISIDAKYYLMDEAFDGLDPIVIDQIKSEIVNLSLDGKAVVISSHNITTLERLVDKTVILYKSRLSSPQAALFFASVP
jgi:ABC-2 type transport system ATP-binding protein